MRLLVSDDLTWMHQIEKVVQRKAIRSLEMHRCPEYNSKKDKGGGYNNSKALLLPGGGFNRKEKRHGKMARCSVSSSKVGVSNKE